MLLAVCLFGQNSFLKVNTRSFDGNCKIFNFAITGSADPNSKDYDCRTPLHSAIVKGSRSYDCVRLLLDGAADVNHKDRYFKA